MESPFRINESDGTAMIVEFHERWMTPGKT